MDKSLFDLVNGRMPKPTQEKVEKKPSLAMRYAMPIVEVNRDGAIRNDSPFSFLDDVRESMGEVIGRRLEYINLANVNASMEAQMECYKHYVVTLFSPFHDHLTLMILQDHNVRNKLYCLIFNELSDFGVNGFVGMNYYLSGPLFANTFFAPQFQVRQPRTTTYYNSGRKLRDITPMPRFDYNPHYFEVLVAKNRPGFSAIFLEVDSISSEGSLAKAHKEHGNE